MSRKTPEVTDRYESHGRKGSIAAVGCPVDCTLTLTPMDKGGVLNRIFPYDGAGELASADFNRVVGRAAAPEIEVGVGMRRLVALAVAAMFVLAACGSGGELLTVDDAWARTSPATATNAAFYMVIEGGSEADTLVSASTDACGVTELHVSVMTDGVMSMQHLHEGIDVPAEGSVTLEPGSFHVMCVDRQREFVAGDSVALTLEFAEAGTRAVDIEIRDE